MGFSVVPGRDKQKRELIRLLRRASALSETLRVETAETTVASQLARFAGQLEEMMAFRSDH